MLFILHNNVVLSLFLRAFYYIFYTVFLYRIHILSTHFIYILHIFCSFFSLFLRKNNALLVHYNALSCVFNALSCVFSINFLQFSAHLHKHCVYFYAHSRSFSLCQLLHFLYFCTNFFYTLRLRSTIACINFLARLHKLFPACRRTFSSL